MIYRVETIATEHNTTYALGQTIPNVDGVGAGWYDNIEDALQAVGDINYSARKWSIGGIAFFGTISYIDVTAGE